MTQTEISRHWHDVNPWKDDVVYVPIERLAECVAGGMVEHLDTGKVEPHDVAYVLRGWQRTSEMRDGAPLDAYILPQPDGHHSLGVRYGAEGSEYYSPHNAHPEKTNALLAEYGGNRERYPMSYKVVTDRSGEWCSDGFRLATEDEAECYGRDLTGRSSLVREFRIVTSGDPVNARWENGALTHTLNSGDVA